MAFAFFYNFILVDNICQIETYKLISINVLGQVPSNLKGHMKAVIVQSIVLPVWKLSLTEYIPYMIIQTKVFVHQMYLCFEVVNKGC